jgi:hypothetical protein
MAELPIDKLRQMAETAADLTSTARVASERDRDFYSGHQWTAEEIATLQKRKQPVLTINRIQRKIDAMVGIEQRGRTDPRALARNPSGEQAADVATKALVYVDDITRFDHKRSGAFENMLIEGYGGVEIVAVQKGGRVDVAVNRLRWEEIVFDPHSREKDFSDAAFLGTMKWMSVDAAIETLRPWYQGEEPIEEVIDIPRHFEADGETYDDRPYKSVQFWADSKLRRVRVAQMYYRRDGLWYLAIFVGMGVIFNAPSPYQDEDGQPTCPIELMTAYIDRDNNRFGLVRSMISMQEEINARRSKILHQLNSRQTMGAKGAVSVENLKAELAKPDGHVEIDADLASGAREAGIPAFQVIPTNDQITGQFNLLVESKNEIDMLGPNASLLGQLQGQQSGRAILAQQQAGLVELSPIYDSLRDWTLRVYRQMWQRIRQYWADERWIRVTDDAQAPQFIAINRQVGVTAQIDPATGQMIPVPVFENSVAEMDVDIVINDAPDFATLRQEEFEQLAQMAQQGIPIPPEMLIEASSIRNKAKVLEAMKAQQEAAMQAQAMAAQAQMQIEAQKAQNDTVKVQAQAARDTAEAMKTSVETRAMADNAAFQELARRRAIFGM